MLINSLHDYQILNRLHASLEQNFDPVKAKELLNLHSSAQGPSRTKQILKSHTVDFLISSLFESPTAEKLSFISSEISTQDTVQFLFKAKIEPDKYKLYFDYFFNHFKEAQPQDLAGLMSRYISSSKNWIDFVLPEGNEIYFMHGTSFYFRANNEFFTVDPDHSIESKSFSLSHNDFPLMLYFLGVVGFHVEKQLEFLSLFNPLVVKEDETKLNAEQVLEALQTHLENYKSDSFYTPSIIQASLVLFEKRVLEQKLYNIPTHSKLEKSDISNSLPKNSNNSARVLKI